MYLRLALASLWNRKGSVLLTFLAITVSVLVMLGVEQVRHQAKSSFASTVSGIDLIVGARTGDINLLLYSVFRLGNATNNISWQSYQKIAAHPKVAWTIPISLGDSHRGYRVMGTTTDYFTHFRYGRSQPLSFSKGRVFNEHLDVVLGSEVARHLGYTLGDRLVLSHGMASTSFSQHDDKPFQVVGILAPTGTPVDQTLHVSLAGIEAIHVGWQNGIKMPGKPADPAPDLTPQSITAFMVGLQSKLATFSLQREINTYRSEPLLAILPGVALTQLWEMMAVMENTLRLISALVLLASMMGLSAMMLASLRERQREIAVLRAIGASPWFLLLLLESEAMLIAIAATVSAMGLLSLGIHLSADWLAGSYGLTLTPVFTGSTMLQATALILTLTLLVTTIPGVAAYRRALRSHL